ncbi:hypothetical protein CDL15_Pgr017407 [Punica granatum]|uniref:Uncharacterized protein n=1 Tax=Punica granatum TaxID=22663 RepID=A0A218Y3T7_PUNGR|nr:hypothetical protein CDL15_Pgr017407 [Punica granatum]PKI79449.1 hypothetical protein CRG98_000196 [Punica granatum]
MEFGWGGTRPIERNRKIGSRFGEFGDRRFRELSPENATFPLDSGRFDPGEVQIGHRATQAVPRAISRVHSGPHRGVQGREPPPAAPSPPLPPDPDRPWLTGLGPVRFFAGPAQKLDPFRPNIPSPIQRSSGRFLLRAG